MAVAANGYLDRVVECTVDTKEALELLDVFERDPIHAAALQILMRAVFSDQLVSKKLGPTMLVEEEADINLYFQDYYIPPLHETLRYRAALGYLVFKLVENRDPRFGDRPMFPPVLVARSRYSLIIRTYPDERKEYLVKPNGAVAPDPSYHVVVFPGSEPNAVTGRHRSLISPTMAQSQYIRGLYDCHMQANHQRSHPPVILQQLPKDDQLNTILNIPGSTLAAQQGGNSHNATAMAITAQEMSRVMQRESGVRGGVSKQPTMDGREKSLPTTMDDNQYMLPEGWTIANIQMPEAQSDLLEFVNDWRQHVLALHGVPAAVVTGGGKSSSDHSKGGSIDDNDIVMFQRTLRHLNNDLCKVAMQFYTASVPELNGRSDRSFHLKMIPFTTSSAIQRMFDQSVIHHDSYQTHMLSLNGMHEDDRASEPNEIVHPPLHGNENQTTAIMKKKEMALSADANKLNAEALRLRADAEKIRVEAKMLSGERGESEVVAKQMELEELKIDGQIELLQAKLEFEERKLELDKQRLKISEAESKMKIKENQSAAKRQKTSSGS